MKIKFRCGGFDRRVWWMSMVIILALGGLCAWLFATAEGAYYLAAWTTMTAAVIVALCLLSVPYRVVLSEDKLELRALVESVYIPLHSVVDVEVVGSKGFGRKLPLWGVGGFWGYYGRWIDVRGWKIYRVFATRRTGCVAIHTTKHRYLVSCRTPEMLRTMILHNRARNSHER